MKTFKKFLSVLLVLAVFLSISVSAKEPSFDFITNTKKFTCTTTETIKLNKPLKILDFLEGLGAFETIENHMDVKLFVDSLFNSDSSATIKSDISDDFKKIKYSVETDALSKVAINQNLNFAVNTKSSLWADIDFSADAPKFDIVVTHPGLAKYLYITYDDIFGKSPEAQMIIDLMYDSGIIEQLYNNSASLFTKYADVKFKGSKCTVTLSDEAFDKYILDCFALFSSFIPDVDADFTQELKDFLDKNKFIADSGIVYEMALSGKTLKSVKTTIPFDLNLYDLLINLGVEPDELEGFTREDGEIAFTITQNSAYKHVGKSTNIEFPILTEENSVAFSALFPTDDYEPSYDYYNEEEPEDFDYWIYSNADKMVISDGAYYAPFRDIIDNACSFDSEKYTITYDNGVICFTSPLAKFSTLEFIVGNPDYWCDGQKYTFAPPVEIDGTVWVDVKMFETLFGWSLSSYSWNYLENSLFIEMYNDCY